MSYGSPRSARPSTSALQLAVRARASCSSPPPATSSTRATRSSSPASLPHVLTVGAVDARRHVALLQRQRARRPRRPGRGHHAAVPPALDRRTGTPGRLRASRRARASRRRWCPPRSPGSARRGRTLTADQAAQVVRLSAPRPRRPGLDATPASACSTSARALTQRRRPPDPREPNDDIGFVDGRAFGKPRTADLLHGRAPDAARRGSTSTRTRPTSTASGSRAPLAHVSSASPSFGNAALHAPRAAQRSRRAAPPRPRSRHSGKRTERIALRNHSRRRARSTSRSGRPARRWTRALD